LYPDFKADLRGNEEGRKKEEGRRKKEGRRRKEEGRKRRRLDPYPTRLVGDEGCSITG
jgi:hypothetical protein